MTDHAAVIRAEQEAAIRMAMLVPTAFGWTVPATTAVQVKEAHDALSSLLAERDALKEELAREIELRIEDEPDAVRRAAERAEAAEASLTRYQNALEQYADPRHWGIQRDEFKHPSVVWIGPGATDPVPDAPGIARAALDDPKEGK